MRKTAIIIGAGPAGLTAAYELLTRTDIIPIILEKSADIGGISRTINYKGNRMDMGPHRFFSKSDRVMDWWLKMMPLEQSAEDGVKISYQNKTREINYAPAEKGRKTMLVIQRLTRIYFLRKFFAYPIQLSIDTVRTLGLIRTIKIMFSFLYIQLFPRKSEKSLEDFIVNKFGRQLYLLFFKNYTEKVWGIEPNQISAEWGAQRIKGVSLGKAIAGAILSLKRKKKGGDIGQKETETSLIEQFLYPKYGPGSLWEEVAKQVQDMGGKVYLHQDVKKIRSSDGKIEVVHTTNSMSGETHIWEGDYFFSTMPVKELIADMGEGVPVGVQEVAAGLQYRDFINVGILVKRMSTKEGKQLDLKDNWIYIQERDVKVGRLMIYNNWGGGMVHDPNTTWIGMEYFCNIKDAFWELDDESIQATAIKELVDMDLALAQDVLDITVRRMEKTYPAYFGTYGRFDEIRAYTDRFKNLFLIGRNGMHKYNNADHSMLTAMVAVDNIAAGITSKTNIWSINTEQEYHEEKAAADAATPSGSTKKSTWTKYPFLMDYLWNNRPNRAFWLAGIAAFLVQFIIFNFRYPFANYMPDSYSYLQAAHDNADVNMWPVAYSKFLRLVSVFTHSDKVVVCLQYLFMQCSALLFLLTVFYFQSPGKITRRTLFFLFLFNPVPLYIANYISADAMFIGLSLLWLITLVWTIYQPSLWLVILHGLLLLACFTVRYNAIYYPVISLVAYILSRQSWKWKVAGVALGGALVLSSIAYTSNKMQLETGRRQFSAFGGWQLANNALYMYQHIPAKERGNVPARFANLEADVRQHMDTLSKVKFSHDDSVNSYFYLWSGRGPLIHYMLVKYKKDSTTPYFKKWAAEGPLYADYARYLILKYPMQFAEEFMIPNAAKWAVPPTEFLGTYNMGSDSVRKLAKDWFNYKSQRVTPQNNQNDKTKQTGKARGEEISATEWYPFFATFINALFVLGLIGNIFLNTIPSKQYGLPQFLGLVFSLWIFNIGFSIVTSPVVLRYQIFPILVLCPLAAILIDKIWQIAFTGQPIA